MKNVLKLEELGLLLLFTMVYFRFFPGHLGLYAGLFFVPDVSFALYLVSPAAGAAAYNVLHHKGVIASLILAGLVMQNDMMIMVGLIFMSHSSFDRVFGYGLKYADSFDHTHLGWIGKSAHKNKD